MDITSPARLILNCQKCNVRFVPESKNQFMCTNCTITEEITQKMKARQKAEAN